jgi:murein L,D-transpeptidase YcbB/YkuD
MTGPGRVRVPARSRNTARRAWLLAAAWAALAPPSFPADAIDLEAVEPAAPLVSPEHADPDWHIPPRDAGSADTPPGHPQYTRLTRALEDHLAMAAAGGWPEVPAGAALHVGERDPRVEPLRNRLRIAGDYSGGMLADSWYLERDLAEALGRFQARHGLPPSGVLDERTLAALNVPLAGRIGQLEVTLQRWRWLPPRLPARHVWVNTVATTLDVVESGSSVLTMRVIVGHPSRPTPSLAGELRQVIFNPTWSVPRTIAVEDLLPRQQEDAGYLARHRFRVLDSGGTREFDPATIDWQALGPERFPYRLRQDAGPGNSLGRVRLALDNPFDIYLHDTPARALFDLSSRTLGSGCVRLEDAAALTTLLLSADRPWSAEDTAQRMASSRTTTIDLARGLPIYIVYLTAWVADDGTVNFRRDVYGRDARVREALRGTGGRARVGIRYGLPALLARQESVQHGRPDPPRPQPIRPPR